MNDCNVAAPNVFTPGSDGHNDLLVFEGLEDYPNSLLYIYNRWGNLIYEDANYQNNWNGAQVEDGTYYYILTLNDGRSQTGFVTIINEK
jgi:gliding motility-associated-like protein